MNDEEIEGLVRAARDARSQMLAFQVRLEEAERERDDLRRQLTEEHKMRLGADHTLRVAVETIGALMQMVPLPGERSNA